MNPPPAHATLPSSNALTLGRTRTRWRTHLHDWRFWAVQALVLLATAVHAATELLWPTGSVSGEHLYVVVMYGLYALPIVYASLTFGREGAVPTAVLTALLSLPNILLWHQRYDRLADALQHLVIIALALVISDRVDREITARRVAEGAAAAQRISEARYRALFESVGEAILVFDPTGRIVEANAAAGVLFDSTARGLRGCRLTDVMGAEVAEKLLTARAVNGRQPAVRQVRTDGSECWLEPVSGFVPTSAEGTVIQTLLHDVTLQHQRQRGLEAYARQSTAAQEEERHRIAHELHDGPLQGLVLLCRRLDALANDRQESDERRAARLEEARLAAERVADEIRRLSRDLRPSILDDLGLVPAVRWLVNDLGRRTGVRGRFLGPESDRRMSPQAELGLFRIAQEALRNVERHAGATEVVVTLTMDARGGRLVVSDDGRGVAKVDLSPGAALTGKLGLLGMQERARLCGGELRITTAEGQGTRIEAVVPSVSAGMTPPPPGTPGDPARR